MTDTGKRRIGPAAQLALAAGYELEYHRQGGDWVLCRMDREQETWLGEGPDMESATLEALRASCSSYLAWSLVVDALGDLLPEVEIEIEAGDPEDLGSIGEQVEPAQHGELTPVPAPEQTPTADPKLPTRKGIGFIVLPESTTVDPLPLPPRPAPGAACLEPLAPLDAREQLAELLTEVEASVPEQSLVPAARQKLWLLHMAARARAIQEVCSDPRASLGPTGRLTSRCTELSGLWWPGVVKPLARTAMPGHCYADVPLTAPASLGSWYEVAVAVEAELEALERRDRAAGSDDDGWWDWPGLSHPDPDAGLAEARDLLEQLSGRLGAKLYDGPIARERYFAQGSDEPLMRAARLLRLVRHERIDAVVWGQAVGRLRHLATIAPQHLRERLELLLDPQTAPAEGWAVEVGFDPRREELREQRRELMAACPGPGAEMTELRAWLIEACTAGDALTPRQIAFALGVHAGLVEGLDPADFSEERNLRRRLSHVQAALTGETEESVLVADEPAAVVATRPKPWIELQASEVRKRTSGMKALLVTNRRDPEQDVVLIETLGLGDLDHVEAAKSKQRSLAERIQSGRYDLVLAATGFMGHNTDHALSRAAKKGRVPYARIRRGRRVDCIRALYRDLGLG